MLSTLNKCYQKLTKYCNAIRNLSEQKKITQTDKKNDTTSWDKKMQPLGTRKKYVTFRDKKNHETSWDKKIMQPLGQENMQPLGEKT